MTDDKAREAAEHLQAATLQAIAAGRALLDLLEEAVQEPGPLLAVVATTVQAAQEAVKGVWERTGVDDSGAPRQPASASSGVDRRPRVQHIRVS
jgi:hypothetical protein